MGFGTAIENGKQNLVSNARKGKQMYKVLL
jgi:hypothetical protein